MANQSYRFKNVGKIHHKPAGGYEKSLSDDIKEAVEEYLSGSREEAMYKLAVALHESNPNKIKPILKKAIYTHLKHYRKDFENSTKIQNCIYDMFHEFNMTDFMERTWQYKPFYLSSADYQELQTAPKAPIHIQNYDYAQPIYKLSNTIDYDPKKLKCYKCPLQTERNDVKFYLSRQENMIFAKYINLRYRPENLRAVKDHNKDKTPEEKSYTMYDTKLYNRSLSISMYVLLDGDPNKAMPFVRYDNDPNPHTNLYIGNDPRLEVYGKETVGPHFHFQSEEDSLICLRKFRCEDGRVKFKTGRCNAIDCHHLIEYLLKLDQLSPKEVEHLEEQNLHYNMPFLKYKAEGKKIGCSVDKIFESFIKGRTKDEIRLLNGISKWLEMSKNDEIYNRGGSFAKVIKTLGFLIRLHAHLESPINYQQRKLYSQLEIVVADSLINSICNNSHQYLLQDQEPKYTIQTNLLDHEKED